MIKREREVVCEPPIRENDGRYITYAHLEDITIDVVHLGVIFQVNQREHVLNLVKQHNATVKKQMRAHMLELARQLIRVE